ncbi:MAG: hypothetical protein D6677_06430 [Calditrichaeota bacterium]|nr:MAG: hypothetical protein D6677_06430 [Calditrichota bacterium]
MIKFVKETLLARYIRIRLKLMQSGARAYNFHDEIRKVRNILVILPANQAYEGAYQKFLHELNAVFPGASISTFEKSNLRKNDLNRLGLPNDTYLKLIRDSMPDMVIDLNEPQDKVCSYITALSGAPVRVNLARGEWDDVYNLYFRQTNDLPLEKKLSVISRQLKIFKAAS